MKVIITMAGEGSRFKERGIETEKYRLRLRDRTMFEFAMESLRAFFDHEFVFVTRSDHEARRFVTEKCSDLGIRSHRVVEIDELTSGQATTALEADPLVADDEAVVIYNIDTYIEEGALNPSALNRDGCIPVFETDGGQWSFVKVIDGRVVEVAEKEPISDYASVGLYHFDRWALFRRAFEARGKDTESEFGERYIAPLYNWLVKEGFDVTITEIARDDVHVLGTPEQARAFDPAFAERYDLA